ncbi:MAG: peptide deformylase [Trueperaceae bacterium]|nr:peptide deformylase [Trueperaceae bacterium]
MIHPIRLYGDPVLRRSAAPVDRFDDDLARLADEMIETMHDANGVGLAGPQIGVSKRIFVAAELAPPSPGESRLAGDESAGDEIVGGERDADDDADDDADADDDSDDDGPEVLALHVMVNPAIVERRGVQIAPDGCLSVPGVWVEEMERDAAVRVRFQDLAGAWHERDVSGHFAHVVQHELDHLDGIFYFDRLPADTRRAFLEDHRTELAELQRRAKAFLRELRAPDRAPADTARR